ncbi:MAG: hypothetical protein JSS14_28870 [Proteobacteria bacterium]|nr:hypothetical protein [Pseudomonadota bacterium]
MRNDGLPGAKEGVALERARLSRAVFGALREVQALSGEWPQKGDVTEPPFHWNAPQDTIYAQRHPDFENILHVFQQHWVGIRAAAGSMPGQKLAIGPERDTPSSAMQQQVRNIDELAPDRIVIHGMSDTMKTLVEMLSAKGWRDKLFVVLHGATAQWFSEAEFNYAVQCLELARDGKIAKLHVMKAGFDFPDARLYRPMLFNLSPRLPDFGPLPDIDVHSDKVLIPGWSGWRKNIQANALAAALSENVAEVWAFGSDLMLPNPANQKIRIIPFRGREQTFHLMRCAALTMNVSLVDCHPMVQIEAQTLGAMCLRGPLFLDALEAHPYVQATSVADVNSIIEIRAAVDRVLSMSRGERTELAQDYQCASDAVAVQRYREFLEI